MDLKRARRNGFLVSVALLIFAGGIPSYADSLNLIVNGSFEAPVVPTNSTCGPYSNCYGFHNALAGSDNIGGWQLVGKDGIDGNGVAIPGFPATIMLLGNNYTETNEASGQPLYFHAQDGLQSVDLTGEGNQGKGNGIKQAVGTTPGLVYALSFWTGTQNASAPGYTGPSAVALYIDGARIDSFAGSSSFIQDVAWTGFTVHFAATSNQTVIAFLNDAPVGNNYAGIDNVAMLAVPEPISLALLGVGLILVVGLLKQRSRQSRTVKQ